LRAADVGRNVECVCVDPLNRLTLFCDHVCELVKNLAQFRDCCFNRLDGGGACLNVTVLHEPSQASQLPVSVPGTRHRAYLLLYELHLLECAATTIWHASAALSVIEVKGEHPIIWCCSTLALCIRSARGTVTHGILALCTQE
jgi:hypothetical protein